MPLRRSSFAAWERLLKCSETDNGGHFVPSAWVVLHELLDCFTGLTCRDAIRYTDAIVAVRTGRVHRVIHAILALLHLDLGRAADADHRDAARELGQALLQLLAVVVRGGLLDLP